MLDYWERLMEWIGIDSQMAADAMMERLDGMHDWYVSGFSYDPLGRAGGTDLSLGRFKTETDSLVVDFRYDSESRDGVWPEFEMMFQEVYQLSFSSNRDPDPIYEATLRKSIQGVWIFADDSGLTDKEIDDERSCLGCFWVRCGAVFWRPLTFPDAEDW